MTAYVASSSGGVLQAGGTTGLTMPLAGAQTWTGPYSPNISGVVWADNTLYAIPFVTPRALAISQIGIETTIAGTGSCKTRMGIYLDRGDLVAPGPLMIEAGQIDETLVAAPHGVSCLTTLVAQQQYWLAMCPQLGPAGHATVRSATGPNSMGGIVLASGPFQAGTVNGWNAFPVAGALPNPWPPGAIIATNYLQTFPLIKVLVQ